MNLIEVILAKGLHFYDKVIEIISMTVFNLTGSSMLEAIMFNLLMCSEAFSELSVFDKCGTVILYVTIGLFAIVAAIGILVRSLNKEKLSDFFKYASGIAIGYALAIIVIMLFLKLDEMIAGGEFVKELFYPIAAIAAVGIAVAIGALIISLVAPQRMKTYWIVGGICLAVPIISAIVLITKYYNNTIIPSGGYVGVSTSGLAIGAALLLALLVALTFIFGGKENKENHTQSIVYAAIAVALSFALSYVRFFKLPQGGSITLVSLLPLMLYSYMFGIKKGVLAGFIYGILQAVQDPWIIHPIQFLLDYPIAFAMIGLSGLFKKYLGKYPIPTFVAGGILAGFLRYASHVFSGIFAFASFAGEGYSAVAWGFLYNSFALVDIAIAIAAGCFMLANKAFAKQLSLR